MQRCWGVERGVVTHSETLRDRSMTREIHPRDMSSDLGRIRAYRDETPQGRMAMLKTEASQLFPRGARVGQ
jgi:hypothetical protein